MIGIRACVAALLFALLPLAAGAQEVVSAGEIEAAASIQDLPRAGWKLVATRAEKLTETGQASRFALRSIRSELVSWRSIHRENMFQNAGRLKTVANQIEALGPESETIAPDAAIGALRDRLTAEQRRLMRPQLLAQEAFARADGLILEIDGLVRARDTDGLATRDVSPLNPANWPAPLRTLATGFGQVWNETTSATGHLWASGQIWGRFMILVIGFAFAFLFTGPVRKWLQQTSVTARGRLGLRGAVIESILSVGSIVVPFVGLVAACIAALLSGFFGVVGETVVSGIPFAAGIILIGKFLVDRYFPAESDRDGLLGYPNDIHPKGRWVVMGLAWILAVWSLISLFAENAGSSDYQVLRFPFVIVAGLLLWQLGRVISTPSRLNSSAIFTRGHIRNVLGRIAQGLGILAPVVAAFGYGNGAWAAIEPAVYSLTLIGFVVAIQNLVYSSANSTNIASDVPIDNDHEPPSSLVPVAIGFAVIVLSLPLFALIWGVRSDELGELWTRFTTGFTLGETRISPSSFAMFLVVFLVGYGLTRFIKSTLKTTVMPRTKLDLGGQNAIIAGFGYVGIFISALVAFSVAGIDLSSLAIVAGALSVGIGFGLQNIVSNFVSGIILLIERPIGEGDMIEVNGQMGYVRDISVRSTRIETFDRTDVIVPNSDLVSGQVINWTRGNLVGRAIVQIGVAYGTDTKTVEGILKEVTEAHPMVLLNPPPAILLIGLGADSIDFEVRAILRDVNYALTVKSDLLHDVVRRFAEEGIEIPFAQRDIWLRNPEALQKDPT